MSEFWIETGRVTRTADLRRIIPVHEIRKSFGPSFCTILPAVHVLTGCDFTLALFGIGKKSVIKTVQDIGPDAFLDPL